MLLLKNISNEVVSWECEFCIMFKNRNLPDSLAVCIHFNAFIQSLWKFKQELQLKLKARYKTLKMTVVCNDGYMIRSSKYKEQMIHISKLI